MPYTLSPTIRNMEPELKAVVLQLRKRLIPCQRCSVGFLHFGGKKICKPCGRQAERGRGQRFYDTNKEHCRGASMKYKYDLTYEQYHEMLAGQNGLCVICGRAPRKGKLYLDHDHSTGKARAFLCPVCKLVLGCVHDSVEQLHKTAAYVEKYRGVTCLG